MDNHTSQLSRRQVLASGIAAAASLHATRNLSAAIDEKTPWIDAHSHIWDPDTSVFPLAPGTTAEDLAPRSFTDEELMKVAQPHGVGRVVLIQHNRYHGYDNSYLIGAWKRHPERFRVVGMIDDLRWKVGAAMRQFLKQGVTGFRIVPRKEVTSWLETNGMKEMWKTAADTGQSVCCLINPQHLPEVGAACKRNPSTPVVIDHFARIGIDGKVRENDLNNLCALARHKHVKVKISAYYALGNKRPPHEELIPMIKRLYEEFGAGRLMWASDCPYQLDGENNYGASISLIRDTIDFVSESERRQLLCGTAEETFFFV